MLRINLTIAMLFVTVHFAAAQQMVTISGTGFKDANVYRNLKTGQENQANTNFGTHPRISAIAWTSSSYQVEICFLWGWFSVLPLNPLKGTWLSCAAAEFVFFVGG
jgi:hypothetical protein